MRNNVVGGLAVLSLLSGCAQMTHLTRKRTIGSSQVLLIDAKQRAIHTQGGVLCAEPSPDALSALAASQGANLSTPNGLTAAQSLAIAESAGSIGLRTQSIQLLRDHMYRVCEAYQAKQITPLMVELLHRRFQTSVVAILAIEQLTGAIRAPAVVLGGSAAQGNAEATQKLTALRETQLASLDQAKADHSAKVEASNRAAIDLADREAALSSAPDDQKTAAAEAVQQARQAHSNAKAAELTADSIVTGRTAALNSTDRAMSLAQASGSASAGGVIETMGPRSPGEIVAVAEAVQQIVGSSLGLKNASDFCLVLFTQAVQSKTINENSAVFKECLALFKDRQFIL